MYTCPCAPNPQETQASCAVAFFILLSLTSRQCMHAPTAPKKHKPHENSKVNREQTPAKPAAKKQDNGVTPKVCVAHIHY